MSTEPHTINIQLLNKTWQIRCPKDKTADLQKCARLLDNKMREIAEQGKKSTEHLLAMAALSTIYDLLGEQSKKDLYIDSLSSRVRELQDATGHRKQEEIPL